MIDKTLLDEIVIGRVEPHIYAFTTNTIPNYLKVGDTYRPVSERLKEWEEYFPNLTKKFEGTAKINDEVYFRDYSVHQFLEIERKRDRLKPTEISPNVYYSKEFFKSATSEDVKDAICDIQQDYTNRTQKYQFYNAENRLTETITFARTETYEPRPNQKTTIQNFINAKNSGRTNLLMYAVMRFGKSFTSMCCAVEMNARLVMVVSAKADVMLEWKKAVESHIKFEEYVFIKSDNLKRNYHIITEMLSSNKKVVVFLTLQDLQGKYIKERHQEIFGQSIDLLLVDETHFGARAEKYGEVLKSHNYDKDVNNKKDNDDYVDINEAEDTIKEIKAKITIHLSGTPYRILMGSEFKKEDIIAFYQFTDIVDSQKEWYKENLSKPEDEMQEEWKNPYYGFPEMVRFAFLPNQSSRKKLEELRNNGTTYAFSALLKPQSVKKDENDLHKKFVYEQEILDLLEVIDGSKEDDTLLSFLDYDKLKEGKMCRHIVIVLPYCASCDALEELIKNNANKFKNLNSYEIVNISGIDKVNEYKSPKDIKLAIRNYEHANKKTITLTVNRMLTGSTVPEWDTMLYLKDTASPQEYDQAVFRLQNQYIKEYKSDNGKIIKYNMKPQTLLVDFDPNRMFIMQEAKSKIYNANIDMGGNTELERRMEKELEVSPIITINKDKIERVKATDILQTISNYKKDKGIKDEALEIPVDLKILDDNSIRSVIELENEIGSKAGLSTQAHEKDNDNGDDNDDSDLDIPSTPDDGDNNTQNNQSLSQSEAQKLENSNKKKIQSYYTRILLFAFITNNQVNSLSKIIESLDFDGNKRIAKNLGLSKDILIAINSKMDKFVLSSLDYKIQDLNSLSHATSISPAEKANIAVNKFGKLGDAIVITPSNICDDMVKLLPEDFIKDLSNKNGRILDIAGTSGEFAVSLYKRMTELGLEKNFINNAIFTIPKSTVCYELTRKLYEMLGLKVENIAKEFVATDLLTIKNDNEIDYEKIKAILLQNKPFDQIKITDATQKGENIMTFDAIVGNPPYQEEDGGALASAKPIYNIFVKIGKKLSQQYLTIIMPTRWFAGGKGLDEFRLEMLEDVHIRELHDFLDPKMVFLDTNNRGGICYFLQDKQYDNKTNLVKVYTHISSTNVKFTQRKLKTNGDNIFIRDGRSIEIINKVSCKNKNYISEIIAGRNPFNLESNIVKKEDIYVKNSSKLNKPVLCYGKGKQVGYVEMSILNKNLELINKNKVFIPRANNIGTELNDDNLNAFIGNKNEICTEAYLLIGKNNNFSKEQCVNIVKYFKTKFARIMHSFAKASQDATAKTFQYVPIQDFTENSDIDWSKSIPEIDQQLYRKYGLTEEEISFIESMIKPME